MKITVVTPCLNSEKYIEETMESVLNQTVFKRGAHSLEYIICDGGSTDTTLEIVNRHSEHCKIISGPDKSMYDGLAKGLKVAAGSIVSYINAGDIYQKTAFEIVAEIFEKNDIEWLCGYSTTYNTKSSMLFVTLPYKFRNNFIQKGMYGKYLPFVQQESVFWKGRLNQYIDWEKFSDFKLAGDYYLWKEFSKHSKLYIVMAVLGGFKIHPNQLTEKNIAAYRREMGSIAEKKITLVDRMLGLIEFIIWHCVSDLVKQKINPKQILRYNFESESWIYKQNSRK